MEGAYALAINNLGQAVGYAILNSGEDSDPYLWSDGDEVNLLPSSERLTEAYAINDNGKIVGGIRGTRSRAFSWINGTLKLLPTPFEDSFAHGINNKGFIVGFMDNEQGKSTAVMWRPDGTIKRLGAGPDSVAYAISDNRSVVGTVYGGKRKLSFGKTAS